MTKWLATNNLGIKQGKITKRPNQFA